MHVRELIDILSDHRRDAEVELAVIAPVEDDSDDITVDRYPVDGVLPWEDDDRADRGEPRDLVDRRRGRRRRGVPRRRRRTRSMSERVTSYADLFRLDGRRALVVGAGSGIGAAVAAGFAAFGADVVCADARADAAATTADAIGGRRTCTLDLLDPAVRSARRSTPSARPTSSSPRRRSTCASASSTTPTTSSTASSTSTSRARSGCAATFGAAMAARRARLDDRLLVDPLADDRARPGRLRGHEGGDGHAVQDARRRARPARRARQHDRPRRGRDAADRSRSRPRRRGTRRTPTRRSCAAGRSRSEMVGAAVSTLPPMPAATSPARRCSSTAAGRPPTAASTRRPDAVPEWSAVEPDGATDVTIDADALVEFTQELVRIPSVHDPARGLSEQPAAELVAEQMRAFGWTPEHRRRRRRAGPT